MGADVLIYIHILLTSVLVGGEWSPSRPGHFNPRETALGTHLIGGWVSAIPDAYGRMWPGLFWWGIYISGWLLLIL
jgi:hypothetical protein